MGRSTPSRCHGLCQVCVALLMGFACRSVVVVAAFVASPSRRKIPLAFSPPSTNPRTMDVCAWHTNQNLMSSSLAAPVSIDENIATVEPESLASGEEPCAECLDATADTTSRMEQHTKYSKPPSSTDPIRINDDIPMEEVSPTTSWKNGNLVEKDSSLKDEESEYVPITKSLRRVIKFPEFFVAMP